MTNMILYEFAKNKEYTLKNLVNDYEKNLQDNMQGIIFSEYDDEYMKATYWLRKKKKEYKYNIDKRQFEEAEEEVINIAEFEIQMDKTKLIVFGNKQLAQRIITLIGIISKNAYTVSEYVIDINMLVNRICKDNNIELLKMKLVDITIDKGLLVNCNVNLLSQNNPTDIAHRYVGNIVVLSFKFKNIHTVVTIYKNGKIVLSKINDDDREELIRNIYRIVN